MHYKSLGIFLCALAIISAAALFFKTDTIENDISTRVSQELKDKGYGLAIVRIDGRNIVLEGAVPNKSFATAATDIAKNVYGVYRVSNKMTFVETPTSSAQPTPAPRVTVTPSTQAREYKTTLRFSPEKVEMSGFVPSAAIKQDINDLVRTLAKDAQIIDDLRLDSNSPNNWRTVFGLGFSQLSRLERGGMELTSNMLKIQGAAWSMQSIESIKNILYEGLPDPYLAELNITQVKPGSVVEREKCQTLVNANKSDRRIFFDTDSARIKRLSYPLLDKLAYTLKRCPNFKVKIEGHTDSKGDGARNWRLSKERAESVKFHLVDSGLDQDRIYTRGYGEARPIASNLEPEGRALNRRIELIVTNRRFVKKKE